jgi:hypothetical protein
MSPTVGCKEMAKSRVSRRDAEEWFFQKLFKERDFSAFFQYTCFILMNTTCLDESCKHIPLRFRVLCFSDCSC